jgi:hypothetical protein
VSTCSNSRKVSGASIFGGWASVRIAHRGSFRNARLLRMKALHSFETLGTTCPKTKSLIPELECPMEILLQFFSPYTNFNFILTCSCVSVWICSMTLANLAKYYNSQKSLEIKLQIKTSYTFHAQQTFATNITLWKRIIQT